MKNIKFHNFKVIIIIILTVVFGFKKLFAMMIKIFNIDTASISLVNKISLNISIFYRIQYGTIFSHIIK